MKESGFSFVIFCFIFLLCSTKACERPGGPPGVEVTYNKDGNGEDHVDHDVLQRSVGR